jgi:hypothetical protein
MSGPGDGFRPLGSIIAASSLLGRFVEPQHEEEPAVIEQSELIERIWLTVLGLAERVDRLEVGLEQSAAMGLTIREVQIEGDLRHRDHEAVLRLLAAKLGYEIVRPQRELPPAPPRPRPTLAVDNTTEGDH